MLYELIAIVRPGRVTEVREIAKTAGTLVLSKGGVVRGITNWGTFLLPRPLRKNSVTHHQGHHFIMRFDSCIETQHTLRRALLLDPRLLKFAVIKMGTKLEEVKDIGGQVPWGARTDENQFST